VFTPSHTGDYGYYIHGRKSLAAIVKGKDARAMLRLTVSDKLALPSQVAALPPGTKASARAMGRADEQCGHGKARRERVRFRNVSDARNGHFQSNQRSKPIRIPAKPSLLNAFATSSLPAFSARW
jgi:hypothetical protein